MSDSNLEFLHQKEFQDLTFFDVKCGHDISPEAHCFECEVEGLKNQVQELKKQLAYIDLTLNLIDELPDFLKDQAV